MIRLSARTKKSQAVILAGAEGHVRGLISEEKLRRFLNDDRSWDDASKEYVSALAKAARLCPPFHLLEVWFRNRVHQAIATIISEPEWLIAAADDPDSFSSLHLKRICHERDAETLREQQKKIHGKTLEPKDFTYRNTLSGFQEQIGKASDRAKRTAKLQSRNIREGDLLANLEFGFWVTLCGRHYASDLHDKRMFEKVFLDFPFADPKQSKNRERQRAELREHMHKIKEARNRVFHHEFVDVARVETLLWTALSWLCQASTQTAKQTLETTLR